jgi:hypothetical protein
MPGIIPAIAYLLFIKPGGTTYESLAVDQTLKDGETLPMANDIEVIHSPGHCAGHIALRLRQEGVLIAGDICSNIMGLSYSVLNEDRALARGSIVRVAAYPFERAVFGHGKLLNKRATKDEREPKNKPHMFSMSWGGGYEKIESSGDVAMLRPGGLVGMGNDVIGKSEGSGSRGWVFKVNSMTLSPNCERIALNMWMVPHDEAAKKEWASTMKKLRAPSISWTTAVRCDAERHKALHLLEKQLKVRQERREGHIRQKPLHRLLMAQPRSHRGEPVRHARGHGHNREHRQGAWGRFRGSYT